jgi:hypothetical protein
MKVLLFILCMAITCHAKFYAAVCSKSKGTFPFYTLVSGVCMIDNWDIVMHDYDTYSLFVGSDGHDESNYRVEIYRYGVGTSVTYAKKMVITYPDGSQKEHSFDKDDYCDADGRKYYSWSDGSDEMKAWAYDHCHKWCSTEPN